MAYEDVLQRTIQFEARCPLCFIMEDREFEIISHLQYTVTQDDEVRRSIAHEGGFCDFHFRQFRKIANSETNALLLITMVNEYVRQRSATSTTCRICADIARLEKGLLDDLARLLHLVTFRQLFAESGGVCLGHLSSLQERCKPDALAMWLGETQIRQMERLMPDLVAMRTLSYFDATHSQRSCIVRVVEKYVGRKALGL